MVATLVVATLVVATLVVASLEKEVYYSYPVNIM